MTIQEIYNQMLCSTPTISYLDAGEIFLLTVFGLLLSFVIAIPVTLIAHYISFRIQKKRNKIEKDMDFDNYFAESRIGNIEVSIGTVAFLVVLSLSLVFGPRVNDHSNRYWEQIVEVASEIVEYETVFEERINTNEQPIHLDTNPQFLLYREGMYRLVHFNEFIDILGYNIANDPSIYIVESAQQSMIEVQRIQLTPEEVRIIEGNGKEVYIYNYYRFVFHIEN